MLNLYSVGHLGAESIWKNGESGVIFRQGSLRNCLVRAHEKANPLETHRLVSLLELCMIESSSSAMHELSNLCPKVVFKFYEMLNESRSGPLRIGELLYVSGATVSLEEIRVAWVLGC
jgi:hypothetical protein